MYYWLRSPGGAQDFGDAFWRTLQIPQASDYIVVTGKQVSVRDWAVNQSISPGSTSKISCAKMSLLGYKRSPLLGDISCLIALTGWQPHVSFDKILNICLKRRTTLLNAPYLAPYSNLQLVW